MTASRRQFSGRTTAVAGIKAVAPIATVASITAVALVFTACSPASSEDTSPNTAASNTAASNMTVAVTRTLPHDPTAFTQGLEVSGNELFESTGRNGTSYVRVTDLESGAVLRQADLSEEYFGEGFTVAGDIAWQITWRDGVAFARDPGTLAEVRRVDYDGEGWGLCHSEDSGLVMSDGSSTLTFRDADSFDVIEEKEVTLGGRPLSNLNELECASDGYVYANVWQSFDIARIDPQSGAVTAMIDASPLWESLTAAERAVADVLNGIAQIPGTDRFLVTGKLWPNMYEVEFQQL
ncbi:glutaminyl-peptide cyclotransferase [Rhodococcoides yunnanense]|jgi:glutamine cyclotransferase|uniref:glutaminyl-peptide cyclotransferase n=1 Tax=Rhodococcoides yunnanense TaxID=278209 RepID=UPI0022B1612B|nr:glutaminyl-peptide cyclotransferase [Rhodococcus yunnanensis]MCZ4276445.1 glutaminyl-peptide cyclotransferase [Rhodococcus yunnanensis]